MVAKADVDKFKKTGLTPGSGGECESSGNCGKSCKYCLQGGGEPSAWAVIPMFVARVLDSDGG